MNYKKIDDVLLEWAYRLDDGTPDLEDPDKLAILHTILLENDLSRDDVSEGNTEDAGGYEQISVDLWNIAMSGKKLPKEYNEHKTLFENIKTIVDRISKKDVDALMKFSGHRINTSEYWAKISEGKTIDEPKTDVISKNSLLKISVKKGKSQLMSAARNETIATVITAAEHTGIAAEVEAKIIPLLKNFAPPTKILGMNTEELSKSKPSAIRNKINTEAKKTYDAAVKVHKEIGVVLNEVFKDNPQFKRAFIYEAASGSKKFGNNDASANRMLGIAGNGHDVVLKNMRDEKDEAITAMVNAINFNVTMKSNSYKIAGKKVGYRFYSTLRANLKEIVQGVKKLNEVFDVYSDSDLLVEGVVSNIMGKVKEFVVDILEKISKFWDWLKNFIDDVVKYISTSFHNLLDAMEYEPEVSKEVGELYDFYSILK